MSPFAIYLLGYFIVVFGLAVAAYLLNVPALWAGAGFAILMALGVIAAARGARRRDSSPPVPPVR